MAQEEGFSNCLNVLLQIGTDCHQDVFYIRDILILSLLKMYDDCIFFFLRVCFMLLFLLSVGR